jgi:nucleoside-diphosphate-sugar epimerase
MKVLILGSNGFVGRNLSEGLSAEISLIRAGRGPHDHDSPHQAIYVDFCEKSSWQHILAAAPDVIINAAAYGVVKLQTNLDTMYKTNYFLPRELFEEIYQHQQPYWLQLGTAFEYDLSDHQITEESPCVPGTHYGISKLMMSEYLKARAPRGGYCILRPFGMFGKYEDDSKIFPLLINAQKKKMAIQLSPGTQRRDYIFVSDLARFINEVLLAHRLGNLPAVLNIGCGKAISFREYASTLESVLPSFDPGLWQWGQIDFRAGESDFFYSASPKAVDYGFRGSELKTAFAETASHYLQKE